MKSRGRRRTSSKPSKTEMITEVFTSRPMDLITPKEISISLGLDIQLVTSIVNRLRDDGIIERPARGKYRLRIDQIADDDTLSEIARDMEELASDTLNIPPAGKSENGYTNPFRELFLIYTHIQKRGGQAMSQNLLRLSARNRLSQDQIDALIRSIKENAG
ncbi:MAG: type IV toxin-antitoxin system AbiEi family antitoxin domain-containing protein [Thermoplasmatota archaeon]